MDVTSSALLKIFPCKFLLSNNKYCVQEIKPKKSPNIYDLYSDVMKSRAIA